MSHFGYFYFLSFILFMLFRFCLVVYVRFAHHHKHGEHDGLSSYTTTLCSRTVSGIANPPLNQYTAMQRRVFAICQGCLLLLPFVRRDHGCIKANWKQRKKDNKIEETDVIFSPFLFFLFLFLLFCFVLKASLCSVRPIPFRSSVLKIIFNPKMQMRNITKLKRDDNVATAFDIK